MVWGCVSAHDMGNLHICEGTINAEHYIQDLEQNMLPSKQSPWVKSRPVSHYKCVVHYEAQSTTMQTPDCWGTAVVRQARMEKNSTYNASTINALSSQTLIECC